MNRAQIIALTMRLEGGLVDNPKDPGGRTNMGITQRYLDARNKAKPTKTLPAKVDDLTTDDATWLYETDQWVAVHGDAIPAPLAALAFDGAVNEGPGTAVMLLQQALEVTVDQRMGPGTVAAAMGSNHAALALEYAARRAAHYANLGKPEFTLGWMRRLFTVYTAAIS